MNKFNSRFIFILLGFAATSAIQYPLITAYLVALIFWAFVWKKGRFKQVSLSSYDYIPLLFLSIWGYGVINGLVRSNEPSYIVANFAGILAYVFYYGLLFSNISKAEVFSTLYKSSLFVLWLNIIVAIIWLSYGMAWYEESFVNQLFGEYRSGSSTGQLRLFNANQIIIFVLLAISIKRLFFCPQITAEVTDYVGPKTRMRALAIFVLSIVVLIGVGASKGYMLSIIVLYVLFYLFAADSKVSSYKRMKNIVVPIFVGVVFVAILSQLNYANIATTIFSEDDDGNIGRYAQLVYFLDDITLWGKGLGSVVDGYIASSEKPYGYELSYLNVIHKFGIFSFFIFACYLFCIYSAVKGLSNRNVNLAFYSAAGLGSLAYLGPSIGNPILFNPQMVVLHCVAIYLIRPARAGTNLRTINN